MIVLVFTRNRSLSRDSLMLAMRILFCFCPCKARSRVSDTLSQALCNLSSAFQADITLSDSTAPIRLNAPIDGMPHLAYLGQMLEKEGEFGIESSPRGWYLVGTVKMSRKIHEQLGLDDHCHK